MSQGETQTMTWQMASHALANWATESLRRLAMLAGSYCHTLGSQWEINKVFLQQHNHLPTTMNVRSSEGVGGDVVPLHSTTVPLIPALAVNLKVEVMSAAPLWTGPTFVRVTWKSNSVHCTGDEALLHPRILWSEGVNLTKVASTRNGAAVQPRINPWVTVQVYVTTSPGQAPCLPSRVEVSVMVAKCKPTKCNAV